MDRKNYEQEGLWTGRLKERRDYGLEGLWTGRTIDKKDYKQEGHTGYWSHSFMMS